MGKYILVMKSGYEQKVEASLVILEAWKRMINGTQGDKVYQFDNGAIIDLSEVALIKPYRDVRDFPPPPPPIAYGFEPRKESRY